MKILQVCSYLYPALHFGGPAKMVYDLSLELSKKNMVTIYTTDVWDNKRRILKKDQLPSNKNFIVQYFPNIFNSLAYRVRLFTGFGMVLKFFQEYRKFDLIHIHDVFILPQLLIALFAISKKVPLFVTPHGILDPVRLQKKTIIKRLLLPVALYCLRNSNQVFAVSNKEKNDLEILGLENVSTIFNGIPKLTVQPSNKFSKYKNNKILTLLYIGKIHSQKGLKEILLALKKSKLPAQLLIAGPDDGAKDEFEKIITNNKLSNVYFLGFVGDREKKELYSLADLFVHPSYAEGFSISILEAMQEGLPVIISDGCNFPDVKTSQAGFLVRVTNLRDDLTNIFNTLLKNRQELKDMGNRGEKLIENKYTVSSMTIKTSQYYKQFI